MKFQAMVGETTGTADLGGRCHYLIPGRNGTMVGNVDLNGDRHTSVPIRRVGHGDIAECQEHPAVPDAHEVGVRVGQNGTDHSTAGRPTVQFDSELSCGGIGPEQIVEAYTEVVR